MVLGDPVRWTLWTATVILSACASDYRAPTAGPIANVRFSVASDEAILRVYDDAGCTQGEKTWLNLGGSSHFERDIPRLGWTISHQSGYEFADLKVVADQPLHGLFIGRQMIRPEFRYCGVPFTFAFRADTRYEFHLKWTNRTCQASLSRIDTDGGHGTLVPVKTFLPNVHADNLGCRERFLDMVW